LILFVFLLAACGNHKHVGEKEVVADPVDIDAASAGIIEATLDDARDSNLHVKDFSLYNPAAVQYFYEQSGYKPLWSTKGTFNAAADSLLQFISGSRKHGLFPEDYSYDRLQVLRQQVTDTTTENALDAAKWAESDLLFTSAFIRIAKDLNVVAWWPIQLYKKTPRFLHNFITSNGWPLAQKSGIGWQRWNQRCRPTWH
jgi:murein L,D-transpeptidase YcbB/YkuD